MNIELFTIKDKDIIMNIKSKFGNGEMYPFFGDIDTLFSNLLVGYLFSLNKQNIGFACVMRDLEVCILVYLPFQNKGWGKIICRYIYTIYGDHVKVYIDSENDKAQSIFKRISRL